MNILLLIIFFPLESLSTGKYAFINYHTCYIVQKVIDLSNFK